jgi:hypothetical protein
VAKRKKVLAGALAALLLGGLGVVAYSRNAEASGAPMLAGDEDRPPIIVKGGSLTFESGTAKRLGKPWKKVDPASKKNWDQDHGNGKNVALFQLYFLGGTEGTRACTPQSGTEFTVNYDHDNDGKNSRPYVVSINQTGPDKGPMISSDFLDQDQSDATKLVATPSTGRLLNVTIGTSTCTRPREVWVESIR